MKHLKLFFALFAMLALGVGNAWAETGTLVSSLATISSGDTYYIAALNSGTYYTVPNTTIAGQTFTCTQGSFSNNTLTPSSGAGEFVFTAVDGVANAYYIYNTNLEKYLVATGSKKFGYVTSSSSDYGYWTFTTVNSGGFSGVFSVKHSGKTHYMRAYSNSVRCYDGASNNGVYLFKKDVATTSYTVSYNSNGGSGTMSSSTGSSITILDCSFTAPNGKKFSKWNTEDDGSGTSYNPGAVVTEDLTLFAIWEDLPKYTVTLKDDESTLQQTTAGEVVVLPSREGCDGYTFAGWTASWTAPQTAWTTTAPTIIAAGEYTPTANVNLYPVYTQTENAGGAVASLNEMVKGNTLSDGDKIVIVANETNVAMYQETISSSYVNKWDCSTLTTATVSDDSKKWWTVTLTDGGFYLGDATNGYLNFSSNNLYCNSTKSVWTLSDLNNGTFKLQSGGRNLSYRSDLDKKYWRMGGASYGESGVVILKLYKYVEGNSSTTSYISVPDCSAAPQPAVLVSIEKTAGKTEFTEGDTFEKATITATYEDAPTKDVTNNATFSAPNMNQIGEQTIYVSYKEGDVTANTSYKINITEKPKYTITWNNAGTTNTTKVVQGEAFGTLPEEPAGCDNGKKFMGWTAATEVNNDGSGIVYIKETDIPTRDMTYYAVFAVVTSTGEPVTSYKKVTTISDGTYLIAATSGTSSYAYTGQVEGKKFGGYIAVTIANDEITTKPAEATEIIVKVSDGKFSMHDGSKYLYLSSSANELHYNDAEQIVWALDADGKINITTYETRYLRFNAQSGNERFACYSSAQKDAFLYKKLTTTPETVSDYSLDCTIHTEPTWTISKDAIEFADKYVGVSYTETFTISASNLTDDIALAIDGSNFTVSPKSIATDAEFPQTVTVTYAPTAVGTHNATLNITSGSTLSKTIALTGSATEATIYTLTALADINPTDKVIIVGTSGGNTYAMSNDKGTSYAPDAIAVTVIDNKLATDKTNILWNIAKNGDNLTIYPADQTAKWLYCLADENDGVRVGTGNAKEFTIDKGYLYTTQTTTPRHIGIYNNSDWRCYKPSADAIHTNIKDQSFAFYVLPNTDPSISVTPASKAFGVLTVGETATQEFEITALNLTQALSAELTGEGFTKSNIVDNKITITFAPTEVKEYSATLTISAGTEASVSVTLEGEGVAAAYSVTYDKNGAEGDAPTDDSKYVAGDKVTIAGQDDMTKAGYRFAGWKYGENIYKAGAKFTMPAENVIFVAQWEEKEDFSTGYWVLVTDESKLNADDYVVIAAADYNVAMKSYESGNNCKQVEVTKVNNLLTWNENVGVFQLDKSGENYTFQDVNTEQYLYAAGGTSNNYLKAADAIPADENAKKYTWTISIADNKATIKAQIEDNGENKARNTIMYNATEGVNGQLFSCYASGQKDIALYKYQTTYAYTRTVTNGNYGTICLPYASNSYSGAKFYEVSWLKEGVALYLDELAAGSALEAGKPYIFRATSTEIKVTCTGAAVTEPVPGANGLTGTFDNIAANTDLVGHYIIAQNQIWQANDQNTLPANRAYIANTVPTTEQPKLAGRRRVCMGENAETGVDNIITTDVPVKVIKNGQLIIIRNGEKYNVQGQKL